MRTSAPGSERGFTLFELLIVVAIIAIATAGVSFAVRDSQSAQLDRDADRLAAILEAARAQSRASGVPVRWMPAPNGFRFEGLPEGSQLPGGWLSDATQVVGDVTLVLGPEPVIPRQQVVLASRTSGRTLRIATDGLRPFTVTPGGSP